MATEGSRTSKYRLVYFNFKSLGEPIRWIFAYTGIPFEDERIPTDLIQWFTQKKNDFASTVGQLPVLYQDGKRELCQSHVISRYLASKNGLVGENEWDNARIDEVISLLFDLYDAWRKSTLLEPDVEQRKVLKTTLMDPKFKLYYDKLSKILMEEEGDYILGEKLTHADFWLAHLVSFWDAPLAGEPPLKMPPNLPPLSNESMQVGLIEDFPLLKKHKEAVTSIPQIKDWISKRPNTAL